MHNFFVGKNQIDETKNQIVIVDKDVNHIRNVLRAGQGDKLKINCNDHQFNKKYRAEIIEIAQDFILCKILEKEEQKEEAPVYINIIQALPKSDKMELIIQKCTELGVKEFTPLQTKRSIVKLDEKDEKKKIQRWQNIAEVASKQCGRNQIPIVNSLHTIGKLREKLQEYDNILVTYEEETQNFLKAELRKVEGKSGKIAVLIGPEGGWEKEEIEELKKLQARSISLGKRILRTETVALVLSSIIMYELGDLGG